MGSTYRIPNEKLKQTSSLIMTKIVAPSGKGKRTDISMIILSQWDQDLEVFL